MSIGKGYLVLAARLEEAANSHRDVARQLQYAVSAAHQGSGSYGYYLDHTGDGESGDCIYSSGNETKKAPYSISKLGDKTAANVDTESAVKVIPTTSYPEAADDDDHYSTMEAAAIAETLYTELPIYERFISKGERDSADGGSFAGKGKSYPILKPQDVSAAVHAMGRAGSGNFAPGKLKSNIMKIAKSKGWTAQLPKAWQDSEAPAAESAADDVEGVRLVESSTSALSDVIRFTESAGELNPLVKIISAGRGSSGYYTKEVLQRDGPKIFDRGTLMYINHATDAEEAARPAGDYSKLAAVTTGRAAWDDYGKDGPALYAPAKVFANVATEVREKAPWTGVSIRACGLYAESAGSGLTKVLAESKMAPDGRPGLIGRLTRADSIDLVTKAGRDGKLLLESASEREEQPMDAAQLREMQDLKVQVQNSTAESKKLRERLALFDAGDVIKEYFTGVRVGADIQERVTKRILERAMPFTAEGDLDKVKLTTLTEAETKDEAAFVSKVSGRNIVVGMGAPATKELTEADKAALLVEQKRSTARFAGIMGFEGPGHKVAHDILREGRSAFDPYYNAANNRRVAVGVEAE